METNYLIIWKRESYDGVKKTPLTILVNESSTATDIYQRIITELSRLEYIKEYEVNIKGVYKL